MHIYVQILIFLLMLKVNLKEVKKRGTNQFLDQPLLKAIDDIEIKSKSKKINWKKEAMQSRFMWLMCPSNINNY